VHLHILVNTMYHLELPHDPAYSHIQIYLGNLAIARDSHSSFVHHRPSEIVQSQLKSGESRIAGTYLILRPCMNALPAFHCLCKHLGEDHGRRRRQVRRCLSVMADHGFQQVVTCVGRSVSNLLFWLLSLMSTGLQRVPVRGRSKTEARKWTGDSLAGPWHLESRGADLLLNILTNPQQTIYLHMHACCGK
jgi:hypothetical protein